MSKILLLKSYEDLRFQNLFRDYFLELGIKLDHDTKIFDFMKKSKKDEKMKTYVYEENHLLVGFIMFQEEVLLSKSEFFNEHTLFIREFYVSKDKRRLGIGLKLLKNVELFAKKNKIMKLILTTHTKKDYYIDFGYQLDLSYQAKNNHEVLVKYL